MRYCLILLLSSLILFTSADAASDLNRTATSRIEVIITVTGVQETVASIQKSTEQIAALTERLSDKKDFTSQDHKLILALTDALNNNARAINNIADALPKQFEEVEGGINTILDRAKVNVQEVVSSSKSDLIDPTLSRIENRLLILVLVIAAVLFGLLWYGLWKVRAIVSTGSETVGNIMNTVKSLEKVLEKVNVSEKEKPNEHQPGE
ncbi:MAG: hypothetical protein MUP09_05775 [Thiovulaceae bacterium]|nr:hypothetical protein [Sulfurimonadaceae bacterium]